MYVNNVIHPIVNKPKDNITLSKIIPVLFLDLSLASIAWKKKNKDAKFKTDQQTVKAKQIPIIINGLRSNKSFLNRYTCKKLRKNIPTNINKEFFCTGSISKISFIIKGVFQM